MIPVLRPLLPTAEDLLPYLRTIDARRVYSNFGPLGARFAFEIGAYFSLPGFSVTLASSGTAALCGTLLALKVGGDRRKALMPSLTFAATAIAAQRSGLVPHIVDVDEDTWMLDPDRLIEHPAIDDVAVVVPVAPYGRPVPQEPWVRFTRRTGIPVVIDGAACFATAQADPATYLGPVPVAMSFHATKSFGIGEGGCVICTDPQFGASVACALNFGFFGARESIAPSLNGKMSEYHAAIGLAALRGWPERRRALTQVASWYRDAFPSNPGGDFKLHAAPDIDGSYTLLECLGGEEAAIAIERELVVAGIGTRFWYGRGLTRHRQFADLPRDPTGNADAVAARMLGLPSSHDLTGTEIGEVAAAVRRGLSYRRTAPSVPGYDGVIASPPMVAAPS